MTEKKKPTGQEPQVEKTPEQLDAECLARQQKVDRDLALTMHRNGPYEDQIRVSMLRQRLSDLPEIPASWDRVEMEVTFIDSLSLDRTLRRFNPDDVEFKAANLVFEDGSKWLVLDVKGEDSRGRSRVARDFMMAMERPRDLSIELSFSNNVRLNDHDRLCWRLDPVAPPLAPAISA